MRVWYAKEKGTIQIGRTSENDALTVRFDVRDWPELYGVGGSFALAHQRPGDAQPYVCAASVASDGFLDWTVEAVDVEKLGFGECQLTYILGGTVAKSAIFRTNISRSLGQSGDLPEPYESKIDELIEAAGNITTDANRAETARTGAETAQRKAEQAQTAAETAQRKAEQAQAGAEQAKRDTDAAAAAALESISSAKTAAVSDVGAAGDAAVLRVQQEGGAQVAAATEQAENAAASAGIASQKANLAGGSATAAAADALKAEGHAVGKQNGTDVQSGSPYYHNNAKYYNEQAAGSAQSAGDAKTAAQTAQGKAEEAQAAAEQAKAGIDAEIDTIAKEPTAQDILTEARAILASLVELVHTEKASARYYDELPEVGVDGYVYITHDGVFEYDEASGEYISCAGSSGDLNGFSFALNEDGTVLLTYTNPEDETDTDSAVLPANSTGVEIAGVLADINDYLEIIAGGTT